MWKDMGLATIGFAVTSVAIAAPSAPTNSVKDGVDAWDHGDYRAAVTTWRPLALAGDADAQYNLAQAYKLGRGVPVDLILAQQWFRRAALQGHALAEDNYGLSLFQNGDHPAALPWLQKSAARGEPRAQLVLGTMMFNGDSVEKDWVKAYAWVSRSAAAGLDKAAQALAQMDGYIGADDRRKGLELAKTYEAEANRLQAQAALQGSLAPAAAVTAAAAPPPKPQPVQTAAANTSAPAQAKPAPTVAQAPAAKPGVIASAPATSGKWRVQLGAFKAQGAAATLWRSLQPKVPALAALTPAYVDAAGFTRLHAGPLASASAAAHLCTQIKARVTNAPCVPVAP